MSGAVTSTTASAGAGIAPSGRAESSLMITVIAIGGPEFSFSAAHSGLHDGRFEPLHGHTYWVRLRVAGEPDGNGMLVDFTVVKKALRQAIEPLRRRTLIAADSPGVSVTTLEGQVCVEGGGKRYVLPAGDVALLPLSNTTTEAIARHLLDGLLSVLAGYEALAWAELELSEAPDTAATVRADLPVRHRKRPASVPIPDGSRL